MVAVEHNDLLELKLPSTKAYRIRRNSFSGRRVDHFAKQRRTQQESIQGQQKRCGGTISRHPSRNAEDGGPGVSFVERPVRIPNVGTLLPESFWANPVCQKACVFKVCHAIKVREAIGQGSFGTVFKITVGKEVAALKCVQKSPKLQHRLRELEKVKSEFSVWRAVSEHPNVISLIAFLQTDKNWCFVMEYAPSGSLSHCLKDVVGGPLEIEQSRRLAAQLAHAIFCVHQMGFLHRDISCSNVLLVNSPNHPTLLDAKLTDFGLSLRAQSSSSRCGSLAYMSPEVLSRTPYSTDADWWSYGIVVYCMFVGRTPLSVFAKKENIELSSLSRGMRYELAKTVSIHISRDLAEEQRSLLIDILQDNPWDRLGVWRLSYPDGTVSDTLEPLRRHKFFAGFDWSSLSAVERNFKQQQQSLCERGPLDSMDNFIQQRCLSDTCRTSSLRDFMDLTSSSDLTASQ